MKRISLLPMVVALAVVLSGCASHPEVYSAEASGDGQTLYIEVGACNGDHTANVAQSDEEVVVSITDHRRRNPLAGGDDCNDVYGPIKLGRPLGDRQLIDGFHDAVIPVRYSPWNQTKYTDEDYLEAVQDAAACIREMDPDTKVTIVTNQNGYPDLDVEAPDLGDGESSIGPGAEAVCIERHIEPLQR